jgi:hypothetical protein
VFLTRGLVGEVEEEFPHVLIILIPWHLQPLGILVLVLGVLGVQISRCYFIRSLFILLLFMNLLNLSLVDLLSSLDHKSILRFIPYLQGLQVLRDLLFFY